MSGTHQYLTSQDVEKIKAELNERKVVTRHKLLDEVKEARAQGDYSENFELYAAKKAKNQNESRIRYLENVLKNSTVISDKSVSGEVCINNTVTIYYPDDDEEQTFKITTSIRSNSMEGRLDVESPLAKALMHHHEGDTVTVHVSPDVNYDVKILKIDSSTNGDDDLRSF